MGNYKRIPNYSE